MYEGGEMEFEKGYPLSLSFSIRKGKEKSWGGGEGGRPVSASSGRMRKSRLCRLKDEERRASAWRMFDWRLPSWGENWRHAMRIFFREGSERGGGLFV